MLGSEPKSSPLQTVTLFKLVKTLSMLELIYVWHSATAVTLLERQPESKPFYKLTILLNLHIFYLSLLSCNFTTNRELNLNAQIDLDHYVKLVVNWTCLSCVWPKLISICFYHLAGISVQHISSVTLQKSTSGCSLELNRLFSSMIGWSETCR